MAPAQLKGRRSLRWAGMVRKRAEDSKMRPGETPRTGTGTGIAACAACAVPALYCTQRTREVTGKAGYAREGRSEDVHGNGERPGRVHGSGIARQARRCPPRLSRRPRRRGARTRAFGAFSSSRATKPAVRAPSRGHGRARALLVTTRGSYHLYSVDLS
ncbi:hypothetical protein FB451DRAFT_1257428, partial [Mycena latifolia]